MAAVLSSLHSPPRPLKERPLCSVKPAGSQQGPGRAPPTGRTQAPAIHSPDLTPVIRRVQKPAPREGREGLRVTQHVGGRTSQLYFIPVSQIRKRRLPSPGCALEQREPPGGLQRRQPGQARPVPRSLGAWKPEKPGGLSARCPGDARGAASLSQCQDLAGPSTAASSQTQLRSLNRAIVVPAPRTPSWTRLVRNHGSCRHGPKTWVSALPARRGALRASLSVLAP